MFDYFLLDIKKCNQEKIALKKEIHFLNVDLIHCGKSLLEVSSGRRDLTVSYHERICERDIAQENTQNIQKS